MMPQRSCVFTQKGIAGNNATFETRVPDWESWIGGKLEICRFVARDTDHPAKLYGCVVLSPTSSRAVYAGVCEHSIYISNDAHGMGVGSALMAKVIEASEAAGIWTLYSSIFPENAASARLHEKFGFRIIGRRAKIAFHSGTQSWRDTLLLERRSTIVGTGELGQR